MTSLVLTGQWSRLSPRSHLGPIVAAATRKRRFREALDLNALQGLAANPAAFNAGKLDAGGANANRILGTDWLGVMILPICGDNASSDAGEVRAGFDPGKARRRHQRLDRGGLTLAQLEGHQRP